MSVECGNISLNWIKVMFSTILMFRFKVYFFLNQFHLKQGNKATEVQAVTGYRNRDINQEQ